jgi:hypothetical protein
MAEVLYKAKQSKKGQVTEQGIRWGDESKWPPRR